jgi:hypothetical protein
MSADPYIVRIPEVVADPKTGRATDEFMQWLVYDNRFKHDLWQDISGPSSDITEINEKISQNESFGLYLNALIDSLKDRTAYYSVSSTHTTSGNEFVRVTASTTVTLNSTPIDLEEVWVQPNGFFQVTISGTINGESSVIVNGAYDTVHLKYLADAGEWVIQ